MPLCSRCHYYCLILPLYYFYDCLLYVIADDDYDTIIIDAVLHLLFTDYYLIIDYWLLWSLRIDIGAIIHYYYPYTPAYYADAITLDLPITRIYADAIFDIHAIFFVMTRY